MKRFIKRGIRRSNVFSFKYLIFCYLLFYVDININVGVIT